MSTNRNIIETVEEIALQNKKGFKTAYKNAAGQILFCIYPDGFRYWNIYDSNGNITLSSNTDNRTQLREYDKNNRVIYVKNSDGSEWWNEYDDNGVLISERYPDGTIKRFRNNNNTAYKLYATI